MTDTSTHHAPAEPHGPPRTADELAALTSGSGMWTGTALPGEIRELTYADGPHGLRYQPQEGGNHLGIGGSAPATCFPPAVALGSTWDPDLCRQVGEALGDEARSLGVDVVLGPGLNIKRSPLGGRNFEYFSEDPHLSGRLAGAMVDGIQSRGVAATPKHFAVNNQETDRLRVDARVDPVTLHEVYLRAFEHVVTEHRPWAMMCAYNKVNGTHASEHPWLLTEVLRDRWGFDGVMMSDWGAVADRVAALGAGMDLEMPPSGTDHEVVVAVQDGRLDGAVLDRVRARVRLLAERTGEGHPDRAPGRRAVDLDAHHALARRAAAASVVLLTNNGTLPLAAPRSVAVVGDLAVEPRYQGGGSSRVVPTRLTTPLDALVEVYGADAVTSARGFASTGGDAADAPDADALRAEAVALADTADVALVFLGQPHGTESEGFDRTTLRLPDDQLRTLAAVARTGTPVVAVVVSGGVVELDEVVAASDAVVAGWLLGQAGGEGLVDVLTGAADPSGRLAESFPHRLEDNPSYPTFPGADGVALYGEGRLVGYRFYDALDRDVAFPFGHGLSYTTFAMSDLVISPTGPSAWDVAVTLTNTGTRPGTEVVQVYARRDGETAPPRACELRGFRKVALDPGESSRVTVPLTGQDLAHWDAAEERWSLPAGTFTVAVGPSSRALPLRGTLTTRGDGWLPALTTWSTVGEWADHPLGRDLVARIRAAIPGGLSGQPDELAAMFGQSPMIKVAGWSFLPLDRDDLEAAVAEVAVRRAEILTERGLR